MTPSIVGSRPRLPFLLGPNACHRFVYQETPDTFYGIGNGALMAQSLAASGGWSHMVGYLTRTYILTHPIKHGLVTFSMALHGAWLSHYWGFVLAPISLIAMVKAWRRHDALFLSASLPAWFMLVFSAAISVNQTRYNLLLILPFCLAGAMAVEWFLRRRVGARNSVPAISVASWARAPG